MLRLDQGLQLLADLRQSLEHIEPIGHIGKIVLTVEIGPRAARVEDRER